MTPDLLTARAVIQDHPLFSRGRGTFIWLRIAARYARVVNRKIERAEKRERANVKRRDRRALKNLKEVAA